MKHTNVFIGYCIFLLFCSKNKKQKKSINFGYEKTNVSANTCLVGHDAVTTVKGTKIGAYRFEEGFLDKVSEHHQQIENFNISETLKFCYKYFADIWSRQLEKIKNKIKTDTKKMTLK